MESRSFDSSRVASASVVKTSAMTTFGAANPSAGPNIMDRVPTMPSMIAMNGDSRSLVDVKSRVGDESMEKSRIWKLTEITEPSQCRSLRLPDTTTSSTMRVDLHKFRTCNIGSSSQCFYNVRIDEVKTKLKGHSKRITGLAFSNVLNVLVSSGADSQLCVWSTEGWEKQTNKSLQIPPGRVAARVVDTRVSFHNDQTQLLAVHETQIAIYEAPKLERLKQWVPPETNGLITQATYSCDSQSIYGSFEDGSVSILTASTLRLRCRISSTSYLPTNPSSRVYPLVIAAHPTEANQFALGLTDGGVIVLEPLESEGKWGTSPPLENGAGPSGLTGGATSTTDLSQR
ncbi:hypothetical protein L1987_31156 [Smallanthus sonchifolius]|uniref:Uncharacterized protein n=1 Tax=Smallanthus sonchifolius TaxID=185202 RepID=A0ACB9I5Q7_9ASTR|nr:hypothetical protein L1987_31156 [Smallanthus sonchifolius]